MTHTHTQKKKRKKEEVCLHFLHPHKHTTQSRAHHNHNGTSNQPNFTLRRTNTPTADLHAEHGARSGKQLSQRSLRATGASTHCISFGATYAPRPATVHHLAPAARRFAGSIGGDFLRRSRVGAGGVTALTCVFCRCLGGHWLAGFGFDFEVGWIKFIWEMKWMHAHQNRQNSNISKTKPDGRTWKESGQDLDISLLSVKFRLLWFPFHQYLNKNRNITSGSLS